MNGMVPALFERLEQSGLRYVILRNYEQLCDNTPRTDAQNQGQATDIDLVIATEDIPRWREIAVSLAEDFGWDALTECQHFIQSHKHEHHIEIFRYYQRSEQRFLQVDLFHSYLIWGLPFLTEQKLLAGRVSDSQRGLTRIDPVKENTFRLLQIQGLIGYKNTRVKIDRYRDRILKFDQSHGPEFREFLAGSFRGYAAQILDALKSEDWSRFRNTMRKAKGLFWIQFASRHPVKAAEFLAARVIESRKRYFGRPCGPVVKVHTENSRERDRLLAVLAGMKRRNFIDQWHEAGSGTLLTKEALVIREQGGLVIQWTRSGQADLNVTSELSCAGIFGFVVDVLIRQHAPLFLRMAAQPAPPACLETLVEA